MVVTAQSHFQMSSEGGSGRWVGWRPRTTVGFAGPGKSIAGGKCHYISGVATDGRSMLRLLYYYNIRTGSCGGRRVGGGEQSRVGTAAVRVVGVLRK